MRTLIISSLAATLCIAPAMAQPVAKPKDGIKSQDKGATLVNIRSQIENSLKGLAGEAIGERARKTNRPAFLNSAPYRVYRGRVGFFGADEWVRNNADIFNYLKLTITEISDLKIENNTATVRVSYAFGVPDFVMIDAQTRQQWEQPRREIVRLTKINLGDLSKNFGPIEMSDWVVVPPETAPAPFPPNWQTPPSDDLWANLSYYIGQKDPFRDSSSSGERSLRTLQYLVTSALQFAGDYDGNFAFSSRYVIQALTPYVQRPAGFQVPDTNEIYTFNNNLSGLKVEAIKKPDQTVLFYEGQNETPIYRYDGKAAIGFVDSHVALIAPDEAKKLIWKP